MSFPSSAEPPAPVALPEPTTLAIHLDLVGGLAGDMFVAALADALPGIQERVLAELAAVRPAGIAAPEFYALTTGGLRARGFGLAGTGDARRERPATHVHAAAGGHSHADAAGQARGTDAARTAQIGGHGDHGGHGGTAFAELQHRLVSAPLPPATRRHALALLALLGEAEAKVHGIPIDAVHFHELADWDSLLDLVAAGCIAGALEGAQWSASAPPLGGGTVRTAHGLLPVPAPATSALLTGYPWCDDGVGGERVTPTGAAILRHLVAPQDCAGRRADGRLVGIGCGAGTRDLPGLPNLVRAMVFERAVAGDTDVVTVIEFDIDDMTGEEIAGAADRLRAVPGVLDVTCGTRIGKKGRPVVDFRLFAQPAAGDAVAHACLVETSTLGLRRRDERRRVLPRAGIAADVDGNALAVKIAERPDGWRTAKTAHDDVAATAGLAQRRALRAAAEGRALDAGEGDL